MLTFAFNNLSSTTIKQYFRYLYANISYFKYYIVINYELLKTQNVNILLSINKSIFKNKIFINII